MGTKTINITLSEDEFEKLRDYKEDKSMTWEEMLKSAKED